MAGGKLRVICGPTAAGKSALALELAERCGASIIGADSRQIYRGFNVGTAKPSAAERARVPHCGVDVADPGMRYSAAVWAREAEQWARTIEQAGRVPLVVGGTGFYIRALTAPLFAEPALDPDRRASLARELDTMSTDELRRWCERLDPERARLGRAQLLRALEVTMLTGIPLSAWHHSASRAPRVRARYLVVDPGSVLRARIRARIRAMFDAGWEQEVEGLMETVDEGAPAWNATGYGAVRDLLRGRVVRSEATERIDVHTRQYAKRQRTWFRHQLRPDAVTLVDPASPDAVRRALAWWSMGDDA